MGNGVTWNRQLWVIVSSSTRKHDINDQTTKSPLIVITITFIYRNVTELIEIAIKYTKLTLMLDSYFFNSLLSVATISCYLLYVLSTCLRKLRNFCFKMHLRSLGIKLSSMALID